MIDLITKTIREAGIEILKIHKIKDTKSDISDMIIAENFMIEYIDFEMLALISFHVGSRADYACIIMLKLLDIPDLNIDIKEMFVYDEENKDIVYGEEALDIYFSMRNKKIIKTFVEKQKTTSYLAKTTLGNC